AVSPLPGESNDATTARINHIFELHLPPLPHLRPAASVINNCVNSARNLSVRKVRPVPLNGGIECGQRAGEVPALKGFPHTANDSDVRLRHRGSRVCPRKCVAAIVG